MVELNLHIKEDVNEVDGLLIEILNKYPDKVKEYHQGKKGVLGLFMGDLMKISKGKIDPKKANQLLTDKIESLR